MLAELVCGIGVLLGLGFEVLEVLVAGSQRGVGVGDKDRVIGLYPIHPVLSPGIERDWQLY